MKDSFKKNYETIGENVRELRLKLGFTQDQIAQRCSVNSAKISRMENARSDYMLSTLLEVCDALKCDLITVIESKKKESTTPNTNT